MKVEYTVRMQEPKPVEKTALAITRAVGSPASIVIHTILFVVCFVAAGFGYIDYDRMLLFLTTIVSLEAIYLAIFIQMTINYQGESIAEVAEDVEEIQEDVEEISEDIDEIQEDVDELQEDVEEMSEDVEELSEEDEKEERAEAARKAEQKDTLENIEDSIKKLMEDIAHLKETTRSKKTKPLL